MNGKEALTKSAVDQVVTTPQLRLSEVAIKGGTPRSLLPVIIIPTDKDWVVILVSFCQNFLKQGIPLTFLASLSTGTLFIKEEYFIGGILLGLSNILTPISCGLINWYSFKTISIVGPFIIFVALVICYFAQENFVLSLIFLSLLGGFGLSMVNATSKSMPSAWFCNMRGLASQIAGIGQGFGILIVPYLVREFFFKSYGYTNAQTFWLYAGLCIPVIAIGLVVPKLHGIILQISSQRKTMSKVTFRDQEMAAHLARSMSLIGTCLSYVIFRTYHNLMFPRVKDVVKERSMYVYLPEAAMMRSTDPPWRSTRRYRRQKQVGSNNSSSVSVNVLGVQEVNMVVQSPLEGYGCRPFYRVDIFYSGNIISLNWYIRQINQLDYHMAVTRAMTRKDYEQEVEKNAVIPEAFARTIVTMFHVAIWKQAYFVLIQVALFLYYVGHIIPFVFIKDRGIEFGFSEDESFWLIYIIGCGNVSGRIASVIINVAYVDLDYRFFFEIVLIVQGILTLGSNYLPFFEVNVTYGVIAGITMGLSSMLKIGCITRVTGLQELTNAIGYEQVSQGLGIMVGTIVTAQMINSTGTVKTAFFISGFCLIISGLLFMPLKKLKMLSRERAIDSV